MGVLVLAGLELIYFIVASMFWICAEHSADNTGMFSLLLSSVYTQSRPFLLLTPPHQQGGKPGGDTARTPEPSWPKGYSIPYNIVLGI